MREIKGLGMERRERWREEGSREGQGDGGGETEARKSKVIDDSANVYLWTY